MIGIRWQDERCLSFLRRKQSLGIEVLEEILGIKRSNSTSIDEDRRREWQKPIPWKIKSKEKWLEMNRITTC